MENEGLSTKNIVSNEEININKIKRAEEIIYRLQEELKTVIKTDAGPFLAAIYDSEGNLISKATNTVLKEKCSNRHAEMNAIMMAEKHYGTYDLSSYNLSLYVTSEPCIMCLGGIMWSGIKNLYYGVPSNRVEEITGFDEGFKPDWLNEFKKRGITVYGNIAQEEGEEVLKQYVQMGKEIYKPLR